VCPKTIDYLSCFVELLAGTSLSNVAREDNEIPRAGEVVQSAKIFEEVLSKVWQEPILITHSDV